MSRGFAGRRARARAPDAPGRGRERQRHCGGGAPCKPDRTANARAAARCICRIPPQQIPDAQSSRRHSLAGGGATKRACARRAAGARLARAHRQRRQHTARNACEAHEQGTRTAEGVCSWRLQRLYTRGARVRRMACDIARERVTHALSVHEASSLTARAAHGTWHQWRACTKTQSQASSGGNLPTFGRSQPGICPQSAEHNPGLRRHNPLMAQILAEPILMPVETSPTPKLGPKASKPSSADPPSSNARFWASTTHGKVMSASG